MFIILNYEAMPSIVTVTFNPAIDKSTTVHSLIPEKKLNCSLPVYEPGGGGINVARAITKLGAQALAVYLAGGCEGQKFTELLQHELVGCMPIETVESTRENLVVLETTTNLQYRFGMPGPAIRESEWKECLLSIDLLEGVEYLVVSGSLPPGVPDDIFITLAGIARQKNARLIVDTSGAALHYAVEAGVYLIKPNLGELSKLLGVEELTIDQVEEAGNELIRKGRCEVLVVSMGASGAMLIARDTCIQVTPPAVKRRSTVGAGDSMMAGMVLSLAKKNSLAEVLQYGVACGTAATMNPGSQLCKKSDADYLFGLITRKKS